MAGKRFEKNNPTIALNVLYIKEMEIFQKLTRIVEIK